MTLTGFARIVCAVVLAIAASITTATQGTQQLALSQQTHQVFELGAGAPLHVFTLTIGTSRTLTLDVTSKVSAVNVEILTPSGAPIDPALVERFAVGPGEVPPLGALLFEEGFRHVYDDAGARLVSIFSAGGAANRDLPVSSSYRTVTPMGMIMTRRADGETTIEPFEIDWESYNDPRRNAFLYRATSWLSPHRPPMYAHSA